GNGPYLLTTWKPNTLLEMESNPEYWDADNVQIHRISLQIGGAEPTDVRSFLNGEAAIVKEEGPCRARELELQEAGSRVAGYTTFYLQAMWGGHPAIQDQRVRRASSMAIDREAIAASDPVLEPGGSLIPDSVPGWSDELAVPYDVDGARALL